MNVLVAVAEAEAEAEAVNVPVAVAVAEAVLVAMISRRRLFCFDFGIKKSLWLPRCCCFEKETEEEKWMGFSSLSDVRIFGAAMKIKYERSSSFLAKSLFCFDSVIWLPRCFGYEK